jgi:hypothetical protein
MIFVDTGAWVARFSRRDQYQKEALELWTKLQMANVRVVTSDGVFAETITLLGRRMGAPAAVQAGRFLHRWDGLTVIRATRDDEAVALDLLAKFGDQSVGYVDCLSFALMRRHGITTAFTFDHHFGLAGFRVFGR